MSEASQPGRCNYVIDASTAIKLFIDDPLSERAYSLFELLVRDPQVVFHVPDLFFIECTNALLKYVRWGGLSMDTAQENLVDLARLGFNITPTVELMTASLELAHQYGISAYDACYSALSARYDASLITADKKLAQTIPGAIWLGDFQ